MTLIEKIRAAKARRAEYKRTLAELQSMPRDVALDLGLFPEDAPSLAREAVYGR